MMYQGIDLSRFKKIAGDKKTSTLKHSKGHEIRIAHSGLSPQVRQQIEGMPVHMAEGGDPVAMDPESPAPAPADTPPPPAPDPQTASAPATADSNTVDVIGAKPQPIYPVDPNYLKQQDQAWANDLANGHVKPETMQDLFAKKSTLGKVGTLFGLVVGGAGAGLTHQPNAVLGMMQKEIDNDLEAQRASKTNAQNFIKLNQDHQMQLSQISKMKKEGLLTDAQTAAALKDVDIKGDALGHMQANRAAFHHLVMQTNKLPVGSSQRQSLEQKLAVMYQQLNDQNSDIADRAAAASALSHAAFGQSDGAPAGEGGFQNQNNVLRMSGNAPLADDRTSRHMPGIDGAASVPLTPGDREQILAGTNFQNELHRFMDWTSKHSGDLSPGDRNYGETLAAQLQGAYRQATNGGVYKEGEQGFISSIIDSTPTKFFNSIRVLPQLKAVQKESAAQLDERLKSKGFKGYKGPDQYKVVGGVKYKRGPNGEAVKVD